MFIYINQETGAGDFYECAVEKINFFCFIHNHLQGFGIVKTNRGVEGSVFGDLARSQKFDIGRNVTNIDTWQNVVFTKVSHRKKTRHLIYEECLFDIIVNN